jgi:hypothetical protein
MWMACRRRSCNGCLDYGLGTEGRLGGGFILLPAYCTSARPAIVLPARCLALCRPQVTTQDLIFQARHVSLAVEEQECYW